MTERWRLVSHDTFSEEDYPLGEYASQAKARKAALGAIRNLDVTQPHEHSGGQGELGIQDRIFIQRPDGTQYRYIPLPEDLEETQV